jgi:post-segregation antitoxin (ccd killing protein)
MTPMDHDDENSRPTSKRLKRGLESKQPPRETPTQWLTESLKAIEHYNRRIAETGVFGEEYRCF